MSRNGDSLAISIPPQFLRALELLPGDEVEEILALEIGGFLVRPIRRRAFRLPLEAPAHG